MDLLKGILFGTVWAAIGGGIGVATASLFAIGSLGGIQTPPAYWWFFVKMGVFVVPPVLVLSGVPAAVLIARRRRWGKVALISLGGAVLFWGVTMTGFMIGAPSA